MRKELPLGIAGVVGFIVLLDYFLKMPSLNNLSKLLQDWAIIVSGFALALAAVNLVLRHTSIVTQPQKKTDERIYSAFLLLGLAYFTITGIGWGITKTPFKWAYDNFFSPVGAATFSILVFFIASAAFRTFRARNHEATVLLLCGIVVMLGNAPVGEVFWKGFPGISAWLMKIPNVAGNRGVMIGAALGSIAVGVRTLLGLDRAYLGLDQ